MTIVSTVFCGVSTESTIFCGYKNSSRRMSDYYHHQWYFFRL